MSTETTVAERIRAAAAWETEHGRAREDSADLAERSVATLRGILGRRAGHDHDLLELLLQAWPAAVRDDISPDEAFKRRVVAARAWEDENGRRASARATDDVERSVARFRLAVAQAVAGSGRSPLAWSARRAEIVAEHWPSLAAPRPGGGGRKPGDEAYQAKVLAAAAWEAAHGRRVTRNDPDARGFQMLRTHMRRAAAGQGTFAWSPEREAFADEHWPTWRP